MRFTEIRPRAESEGQRLKRVSQGTEKLLTFRVDQSLVRDKK